MEFVEIYPENNSQKKSDTTVHIMRNSGSIFTPSVKADAVSEIGNYWIH